MSPLVLLFCVVLTLGILTILSAATIRWVSNVTGQVSASENTTFTDGVSVVANPTSIPAAQPGVLTTHTTNTTGTLTMTNSNHGIVTGQRIDVYWAGGKCYGAVAGTVSGLTVPIASVSGGDNLPASLTAVTIGIATAVPFPVTGNNLQALVMYTPSTGLMVYNDAGTDEYAAYVTAGRVDGWKKNSIFTNPLAGQTITQVYFSHTNTDAAVTTAFTAAITH